MTDSIDKAFKNLQSFTEEEADLQGIEFNDDNIVIKFKCQLDNIYHHLKVKADRETLQMEVIEDKNNFRKALLDSITLQPTPYNLFMVEDIINSTTRYLLRKIKI